MLLICQPAIYYGLFDFPGAVGRFAYSRLLQVSDYPPRGAYSPVDVQNAQESLVRFFQQNGYFEAKVKPEIQTDAAHGLVSVNFRVSLNRRAKFGKVILKGAPQEEEQRLQARLEVLEGESSRLQPSEPGKLIPSETYRMPLNTWNRS